MIRNKLEILIFVLITMGCQKQPVAHIEIKLHSNPSAIDQYAQIDLDTITLLDGKQLQLFQIKDNEKINTPIQVDENRILYWRLDGSASGTLQYELIQSGTESVPSYVQTESKTGALTVSTGTTHLLRYHFDTVFPPIGIDTVFKRSAFIHPVWTPDGQVLTRIQPPDHYHHYGIWNPWTHVLFEGDTIDFWNLYKKEGTVRFERFLSQNSGPLFSEFTAHHEHVVFKPAGTEVIALDEYQTIRVTPMPEKKYFFIDIKIEMECATDNPFQILEYRYGGLGWRAIEEWNPENSEVLTSENKTRKDADGSTARWCIVQGALGEDYGGMVIYSHPENYNHPEPLRIWPEDSNDGQLFVNVAPTKTRDWLLEPAKTYTLRYRLVVFNGHFTKELAEVGWKQYIQSPNVTIRK